MSPEEIKQEFLKCKEDPVYFMRHYIKIVHPIRGRVNFDLYRFQERIITEFTKNRFNLMRKFRQAGATTISAAYALWYITFNSDKNVMVVSIGDRESRDFLDRAVNMYDDLPSWLQAPETERNKHVLKLSTGSKIKSQPAGAGRGESVSLLIVDEAAFIDNMREFWMAIYPTISTGGSAYILSTVNGMANLYYELYRDAELEKNDFNVIDIHWREHPEYTEKWAQQTRSNVGERAWLQEYEGQFLGTGETFIDGGTLDQVKLSTTPDFTKKHYNMMRIFEEPQPYHTYLIAADTSFGRDRDYSAFHIINLYNGTQVAEFYSNRCGLNEFARIMAEEGMRYNMAFVCPERNGLGLALIEQLFEVHEYENMWTDEKGQMGYLVNNKNRDIMLNTLQEKLKTSKIKINSERTFKELTTFIISKTGKIQAESGFADDLVISLAIGATIMEDIVGRSPVPIVMGDLEKPSSKESIEGGFSRGTYNKEFEDYRKWI
mgnify:FL=1|tara:strand:- start:38999 stop:40468 length:1470 start_codon:yes stop_codon:yes gene_type:complete